MLAAKGKREAWASVLDQLTLADFIASGQYDRHIRRMRQRYRHRRDQLVTALAARAPHITATGIAAGLHAVLRLPPGTEASAVKAASWQGIALDGLAEFRHPRAAMPAGDGLVIGYSTPAEHAYGVAVEALLRALPPSGAFFEGPSRRSTSPRITPSVSPAEDRARTNPDSTSVSNCSSSSAVASGRWSYTARASVTAHCQLRSSPRRISHISTRRELG